MSTYEVKVAQEGEEYAYKFVDLSSAVTWIVRTMDTEPSSKTFKLTPIPEPSEVVKDYV